MQNEMLKEIKGLEVAVGLEHCGSEELYLRTIENFHKLIDIKSEKIEQCLTLDKIYDYTVEVHALKNTARMIGAVELSEQFYQLECLGKEERVKEIHDKTPKVLELYKSYKVLLAGIRRGVSERIKADAQSIIEVLVRLHDAIDVFDLDGADEAMQAIEGYVFPEELVNRIEELSAYVADVAMEEIINLTGSIIEELRKMV